MEMRLSKQASIRYSELENQSLQKKHKLRKSFAQTIRERGREVLFEAFFVETRFEKNSEREK